MSTINLSASAWQTVKGDYKADFAASSQDIRLEVPVTL